MPLLPAHILEGKLKDYEKQLVDFIVTIGMSRGLGEKNFRIVAYIMIHKKLTVKQLHGLTGYSVASISNYLHVLTNSGFLRKNKISGTKSYEFYLPSQSVFFVHDLQREWNLSRATKVQEYCRKMLSKVQDYTFLNSRITEFIDYLDIHKEFFSEMKVDNYDLKYNFETSAVPNNLLDPEISTLRSIEKGFTSFLIESEFFLFPFDSLTILLSYLIMRGKLTQSEAQKLTGLSAGSVSQGLTMLMNLRLATRTSSPVSRQYVFEMKSVVKRILRYSVKVVDDALFWRPVLQQIQDTLDKKYDELHRKNGYMEIYTTTTQFLRILPAYERMKDVIQRYL
jgi:DNA-binding transcriptional regulator GbsR (MarR family)